MKLLITGAWKYSENQINKLKRMGHEILLMQDERGALPSGVESVEGVICNGLFLYHDISLFKALGYVQLTSAGYDRVPMDYLQDHGITVKNAMGVYSIPMSEFAVCGVLDIYKNMRFFYRNQSRREWIKNRSILELAGKRVLIVGCGSVGTECAKRFAAFDTSVVGIDPVVRENSFFDRISGVENLRNELSCADVVILTLPITDETKHLFDGPLFDVMKDNAIIVNIGRGAVIDTQAMIDALESHRIFGAVLDVFEDEPLSGDSPLWKMDNVIITPHNSFVGEGNQERLWKVIKNNLEIFA